MAASTIKRWFDDVEKLRKPKKKHTTIHVKGHKLTFPKLRKFTPEAVKAGFSLQFCNPDTPAKASYAKLKEMAQENGWSIGDYSN